MVTSPENFITETDFLPKASKDWFLQYPTLSVLSLPKYSLGEGVQGKGCFLKMHEAVKSKTKHLYVVDDKKMHIYIMNI
jgi:hypothetical protein